MTKTTIVVTDLLPLAVVEEDTMTETDPTRKRMVVGPVEASAEAVAVAVDDGGRLRKKRELSVEASRARRS